MQDTDSHTTVATTPKESREPAEDRALKLQPVHLFFFIVALIFKWYKLRMYIHSLDGTKKNVLENLCGEKTTQQWTSHNGHDNAEQLDSLNSLEI